MIVPRSAAIRWLLPTTGITMRTLTTLAAIAIVIASFAQAIATSHQAPGVDETVTGSIERGSTPASYGLRYRPETGGF